MKRIDLFCASQASTAICLSMEQASCYSSNTIQLGGGRVIDRHNPIITDPRRSTSKAITAPCSSSHPPIDPKPYHDHKKAKKKTTSSSKQNGQNMKNATKVCVQKKKSTSENVTNSYSSKPIDGIVRRSWVKPQADSIIPNGSTRSLLSDTTTFLDGSSDCDKVLALTMVDNKKAQVVCQDKTNLASKPSSSSSPESGCSDQVVVLRVSLHCKGCEGKVRKHLSRMQGVTSFNIDYYAKKVTVVGNVTPLSVLESISKVKNAQFWPASASSIGSGSIIETKFI